MKIKTVIDPVNGEVIDYQNLTDEKTQQRINEHISNINDKITEDDIRNIRTDMYDELLKPANTEEKKDELTAEETDKEKEKKESQKINSAWNIIEEE